MSLSSMPSLTAAAKLAAPGTRPHAAVVPPSGKPHEAHGLAVEAVDRWRPAQAWAPSGASLSSGCTAIGATSTSSAAKAAVAAVAISAAARRRPRRRRSGGRFWQQRQLLGAVTRFASDFKTSRREPMRRPLPQRSIDQEGSEEWVKARVAEMDQELDELQDRVSRQFNEKQAAIDEKVAAFLDETQGARKVSPVRGTSGAEAAGGTAAGVQVPGVERVAVCGVDSPGSADMGRALFERLQESCSEANQPIWVDLLEAARMPFEELDYLLLRCKAAVICPDISDTRRRSVEAAREGLKALLGSFPDHLSRVYQLSQVGAQADKGGVNMGSFFGLGYSGTFAGLEDELTSRARRRGNLPLRTVIIRVGELLPSSGAGPAAASTRGVRCLPGEFSGGPMLRTPTAAAAEAIFQSMALGVNTSFCVVEEPGAGEAKAPWPELLAPFIGPEVWRAEVTDPRRAVLFVQGWASEWFGAGKSKRSDLGLRTPVLLSETPSGVIFKFRPLSTPSGKEFDDLDEGGLEFLAEEPVLGPPRLRVRRCAYGWKTVIKKNSERALLEKFKQDWTSEQRGL